MVNLADSYKAKWLDGSGQHTKQLQIYISGADLSLRNDSILAESMVLKEGIFDGNGALSFAGCIASMFSIDFRIPQLTPDNLLYPSDYLYPGKIETALKGQAIEVKMRVDDDGYLVPIFKGYIDSVQTSKEDGYQHIECYDKLSYIGQQNVSNA